MLINEIGVVFLRVSVNFFLFFFNRPCFTLYRMSGTNQNTNVEQNPQNNDDDDGQKQRLRKYLEHEGENVKHML